MTVFLADEPIEPKSIVACPECGFEFSFNHSEGWSEEGYRFVCYRCRAEQAERERDEARREVERLRERLDALAAHFDAEASFAYEGWQEEKDDYLEGVYRAFRHAAEKVRALAERGERV